uniref:Uncharacterized protein n=1 Tax=Solanum lycopersicum TaxID=4081 RepID=K4D8M1_SOLLC
MFLSKFCSYLACSEKKLDSSSEINNCRKIIPYVSPVNNIRMAVYHHMRKSSICRSVMEVCRYILDGNEEVEVEVDSETNIVKEIKEMDKVEEGENKVFSHLNKSNELDFEFSQSVENMEQVPISQFKNKENAYMEKGLPYEDNYGEKEMIANLANNVEFVTFADFTLETGLDDPFLLYGIENDDFGDAYTPNIKDL